MIEVRRSADRGSTALGWLDSKHSFSFGNYYDPAAMGFGPLRVINEDRVAPGAGFGTHPHDNMEIISYVVAGALAHKDSLGTGSTIRPGDLQRMSAGSGIAHSEFNPSASEPVHFLQIWITPEKRGLAPSYEQKAFPPGERRGALRLVGSRDGRDGSVTIHRDVDLYAADLGKGQSLEHVLPAERKAWVQVVRGRVSVNGRDLEAGDGAALSGEPGVAIAANDNAEVLLFDIGA